MGARQTQNFSDDPKWIQSMLLGKKRSIKEIKFALEALFQLGCLERQGDKVVTKEFVLYRPNLVSEFPRSMYSSCLLGMLELEDHIDDHSPMRMRSGSIWANEKN